MSEPLESFDLLGGSHVVLNSAVAGSDNLAALREQAQGIIDEVLSGTGHDGELIRAKLRASIARHSGFPELALLEHLMNRSH